MPLLLFRCEVLSLSLSSLLVGGGVYDTDRGAGEVWLQGRALMASRAQWTTLKCSFKKIFLRSRFKPFLVVTQEISTIFL